MALLLKILKMFGYLLGGLLVFVLLVVLAVNFLLRSSSFTGFVLGKVLPGVGESLKADIQVESLRVSLFPTWVEIEGAHFTKAEGNYKHKFVEVERIYLDVATLALFSGRAVVEELEISGLTNYLVIKDGLENLPIPPGEEKKEEEKEEDSGPLVLNYPVVIEDFHIEKSAFYMDMPDSNMEIGIRDIALALKASLETGATKATINFRDGFFDMGEIHETLTSLDIDATADLHKWTAEIPKLAIRIPGIEIDADATAGELIGELAAKANLNVNLDAAKAKDFVKDPKIAGQIQLKTAVDFGMPKSGMFYKVDGRLDLNNILVNNLPVQLGTDLVVDTESVEIKGLDGTVDTASVHIAAKLGMGQGMPLNSVVKISSLNVGSAAGKYGVKLPLEGNLNVDLSANGQLAKPTGAKDKEGKEKTILSLGAKGNVGMTNFVVGQGKGRIVAIPKIGVDLDANYAGTVAKINKVQVTTAQSNIIVTGLYDTAGPMNIDTSLSLKDLSEFSPVVGKKIAGSGQLVVSAKGTAKHPVVKSGINFKNLQFDVFKIDEIAGSLGLDGKHAQVDSLMVRSDGTRLKVKADALLEGKDPKITAKVEIPDGNIEDLLTIAGKKELDVKGVVNLDVDVDGTVKDLNGKVALKVDKLVAFGEKVRTVELISHMDNGKVILDNLLIAKKVPPRTDLRARIDVRKKAAPEDQWKEAFISAKGSFDPNSGEVDLQLRTANLNEQFSDNVREKLLPVQADLGISADVTGTIKDPNVKAKIEVLRARYGEFILGDSVIVAETKDQKAKVKADLLANRWTEKIIPAKEGWVVIRKDPEKLKQLKAEAETEEAEDFTKPVTTDTLVEEKGEFGSIHLDLDAALDGDQAVNGKLAFDQFDYSGFLIPLRDEDQGNKKDKEKSSVLAGLLNGTVDINGSLKNAAEILVQTNLDKLYFQKNSFIIQNQNKSGNLSPLRISAKGSQINIDNFELGGKQTRITLEKTNANGQELFWLDADIDMGVAKEFTPILAESKGRLVIEGSIPTNFKSDQAEARVMIRNGLFDVQNSPTAIENFTLDASFKNGLAKADLSGDVGGGKLKGDATVVLDISGAEKPRPPEIKVSIKLSDVKTGVDPYVEAAIQKVDLNITDRPGGGLNIAGDVVIDRAMATYEIQLLEILQSFQNPKSASGKSTVKTDEKETLFFNIGIRAEDEIGFRNSFADIEASLDLLFTGTNVQPTLLGDVRMIKGDVEVLDRKFNITRGVVTFFEEDRIYPNFDINVETQLPQALVFVTVSGTPDNYKISFSSDPPMPERDIFTLLALGVNYEEFQAGEGGGIGGEEAAALAANQLLGSQLKGLTGDSGIEVGIDSAAGQPRLKVRKEVQKDLFLAIFRGIADPSLGAELEYVFLRNLAVTSSWENLAGVENPPAVGAFGAGFKVKIDFK